MKKYGVLIFMVVLSIFMLVGCKKEEEQQKIIRNVYISYTDGKVSCEHECINPSINEVTEKDRFITLTVKIGGGYSLTEEFNFYVNNQKVETGFTVDRENQIITYEILNPNYKQEEDAPDIDETNKIINKIEFTTSIKNTPYEASTDSTFYTIEVTSDKNYTYIYFTVTAIEGYSISNDVYLYVDGNYITSVYNISENNKSLVYRIDDPNWTPFY